MEDWKNYLASAEAALQKLDQDQTATIAKMMALQLGAYRLKYGDGELESFDEFVNVDELSDTGQQIFIKGMESLLSVVREIEISDSVTH